MQKQSKSKINTNGGNKASQGNRPQQSKMAKPKKGGFVKPVKSGPVAAAAAYSSSYRGKAPSITQTPNSCRVVHRELISSITGSVGFAVGAQFEINPGLSTTFPWLALMAQAWEQYEFNSLKFHYVTRTGTNVPGSVMLVPDYDAADSAPADEATASSYQDAIEDAPWRDITCPLRKVSMNGGRTRHFVRQTALAANLDVKTYDVGKFFVLTTDGTAVSWGKLWVEYDVTFHIPQLPASGAGPFGGLISSTGASETAANPFGTAAAADTHSKGISINTSNPATISIENIGTYLVEMQFVGTVITAVGAPTLGAGLTLVGTQTSVIDSGQLNAMTRFCVSCSGNTVLSPATIQIALTATTVTSALAYIASAPNSSLA